MVAEAPSKYCSTELRMSTAIKSTTHSSTPWMEVLLLLLLLLLVVAGVTSLEKSDQLKTESSSSWNSKGLLR